MRLFDAVHKLKCVYRHLIDWLRLLKRQGE
jgi:hypothetical protein